ncbi:hypothetical protein Lery_2620 [Legionella erythra]|uniref:Uncharacterized protein n=1 Tax=Legionella erythra TaxID=448 RepID=A0A0W0TGV3_LEGER|nr:hypothetical protein Lery_2620 [Legionella erythra]
MLLIECPSNWESPEVMCRFELLRTDTKCLNGTEGRSRTDTMSPSPDFESGASTNSATPAHRSSL